MTDVLLARGGFRDDTAIIRLHHAANLGVRTVETGLVGLRDVDLRPSRRDAPACVVFCSSSNGALADDDVLAALARLASRHPDVSFIAALDQHTPSPARCAAVVALLDAGADDVLDATLDPSELAARVTATVRRVRRETMRATSVGFAGGAREEDAGVPVHTEAPNTPARSDAAPAGARSVEAGPPGALRLDDCRRELVGSLGRVALTSKELVVLQILLSRGRVVGRDELGQGLWTGPWSGTKKAIDMHVANLRRKLAQAGEDEWRIDTVRGEGFVLTFAGDGLSPTG